MKKHKLYCWSVGSIFPTPTAACPIISEAEITDKNAADGCKRRKASVSVLQWNVRVRHEATAIDAARKVVLVRDVVNGKDYEESYDKLILSPGAEPVRLPLPGMEDARIFTLRTIPDTFRIHEQIQDTRPKTAVVVGGGFIGLEMAENLTRAGVSVTVVEIMDHVIGQLDYDMACEVHSYLRHKGVGLLLGRAVKAFHPDEALLDVELDNGDILRAEMVLMSVGVRPDTALAQRAGLKTNIRGAILVDGHMRTSDEHIYAVGDAVEVRHLVSGSPAHIPLAGPASKQGRIAADNICGIESVYRGTQGSSILKLFELAVASTGRTKAWQRQPAGLRQNLYVFRVSRHLLSRSQQHPH